MLVGSYSAACHNFWFSSLVLCDGLCKDGCAFPIFQKRKLSSHSTEQCTILAPRSEDRVWSIAKSGPSSVHRDDIFCLKECKLRNKIFWSFKRSVQLDLQVQTEKHSHFFVSVFWKSIQSHFTFISFKIRVLLFLILLIFANIFVAFATFH